MATKDKAQKKAKLRHAEYYDFQEIQDKLYAGSQKGKEFKHLVEIIALPENIRLAYRNIKSNHVKPLAQMAEPSKTWNGCLMKSWLHWFSGSWTGISRKVFAV